MDVHDRAGPDAGPAAVGGSRARVLDALRDAEGSLTVSAIADRVRLHANTVRFHLDALVDAGLAERTMEERTQPGRPRGLYRARAHPDHAGQRSYRLLAEILASYLAAQLPQPAKAAEQAGQAWGRYLTERPPPFRRIDAASAVDQLVRTLDEIGFAPEAARSGEERQIRLRHCPFREAAAEYQDVVCSIHLGLMRGMLDELDAPLDASRLDPFVEPHLCVAHLSIRSGSTPENHV